MRFIVIILALIVASGCGAEFASEREELDYLSSLSNPTPTQWKRRTELAKKADEAARIEHERVQAEEARLARERDDRRAKQLFADAAKARQEGKPNLAIARYEELLDKYPGSGEGVLVPSLLVECRAEARALVEREKAEVARRAFDDALAQGAKYEQQGDGALAARCYLKVAKDYPDEPRAMEVQERGVKLWKLAYGDLPIP